MVRYAVVGLGHIAQVAVIPGFAHARNSAFTAVVSGDAAKQKAIARTHSVAAYSYEHYDECLRYVDAVYIALPNSMHAEYTVRAAEAGVHVLCEKPMAVTVDECRRMIEACRRHRVKLMIAYRLHFEEINLRAVDLVRRGRIGDPKFFNSSFSMTARQGDSRGAVLRFDEERLAPSKGSSTRKSFDLVRMLLVHMSGRPAVGVEVTCSRLLSSCS